MVYSLINMSSFGFDLVRLPHGQAVADLLLGVMHADDMCLSTLSKCHPGITRSRRWATLVLGEKEHKSNLKHAVSSVVEPTAAQPSARQAHQQAARALELVQATPLGSLDALDTLIRRDILAPAAQAGTVLSMDDATRELVADVIVDAAAAHYVADQLDADTRAAMTSPVADLQMPAHGAETANHPVLARALADFSNQTADQTGEWVIAHVKHAKNGTEWSQAMNQACLAAKMVDRLRLTGIAQLQACSAAHRVNIPRSDCAAGAWNVISGALQAFAVADLLPQDTYDVLTAGWVGILGDPMAAGSGNE